MLHLMLKERVERECADMLAEPASLMQDALRLTLDNGVTMELRFASDEAYAIAWRWGEAELRIDTAPLHPGLASFPNHLHDAEGRLCADPLTDPSRPAWDNLRAVIEAVRRQPLLAG